MSLLGYMSEEQRAAHLRLLATLPRRTYADDPAEWAESDRELSPEELDYLDPGEDEE